MKKSKYLMLGLLAVAGAIVIGTSSAFAAETIGTVTGRDGDVKDKLAVTAEIVSVDGSHVTFKDVDSGEEYETSFGPSWYTRGYEVGERVNLIGVATEAENNNNGHNFQVLEINGTELRESFEAKPAWAGTRRDGNGQGTGDGDGAGRGTRQGLNMSERENFIDADGDGMCDNAK